jgi:hypothetical protein
MPKEISMLDLQHFSDYSPQLALAFAKRFDVQEGK